jgi:hypothetical protein
VSASACIGAGLALVLCLQYFALRPVVKGCDEFIDFACFIAPWGEGIMEIKGLTPL